eukprot:gnl/TRDRNA2_/TRDRNA2_172580_c9_seq6.p1 gnl/TRDRNA2_/TRDRNA2_172580_c9~~gnl/TRDRNA2_/TRDRNA2_172580_c9_seq6.p1  ORF type:complete len:153 (-),score=20.08 gnl/TRDRNA2_/TRDRNA2_172580_c9_seq6:53-481(-)
MATADVGNCSSWQRFAVARAHSVLAMLCALNWAALAANSFLPSLNSCTIETSGVCSPLWQVITLDLKSCTEINCDYHGTDFASAWHVFVKQSLCSDLNLFGPSSTGIIDSKHGLVPTRLLEHTTHASKECKGARSSRADLHI